MSYPGGKGGAGVYQTIINQLPPHEVYIEPFAGAASVSRHKRPARRTILVDRSPSIVTRFAGDLRTLPVVGCGIAFLEKFRFKGRELVYCDPPYVQSARRSARPIYEHEMDDRAHSRLLTVLQGLPCMVALSGYDNLIYRSALKDWRVIRFSAMTRGGLATECLWMNYPAPAALHDYRHLGADYRERERIKRKVARWHAKLAGLPPLERQAILSACLELSSSDLASPENARSADPRTAMPDSGTGRRNGEACGILSPAMTRQAS